MENAEKKENTLEMMSKNTVHHILAHSYSAYLFLFLVAVFLDTMFPNRILKSSYAVPVGFIILIIASLLILWAQRTSRDLKTDNLTAKTFCKGPYCYTRSPTHWGLFLLVLGFGIIANAFYIILFSIISFILTKFIFLKKEEDILADKYGEPYLEYKKIVRF